MMRLKLDHDVLGLLPVIERIAHIHVKDCFRDEDTDTIYMVVEMGELGKAVGKGGANIKMLQQELGKKVRAIEYRNTAPEFVRTMIYPLTVEEIVEEDQALLIKDRNKKTKSLLIGRDGRNLRLIHRALQRFFNIKEIKVI